MVEFYRKALVMGFQLTIAEDKVPSTGEPDPYMHVSLEAGNGNVLAFFELPTKEVMGRDEKTPQCVQHIALRVATMDELLTAKAHPEELGIDVLGPMHHGIFKSIDLFDSNGHRLELTAGIGTPNQMQMLRSVKHDMLDEWDRTKKAPRHAAWLHEKIADESSTAKR